MGNKTESRRTTSCELPRDTRAEADPRIRATTTKKRRSATRNLVLSHQRDMPAIQEFLQEMNELDARPATARRH